MTWRRDFILSLIYPYRASVGCQSVLSINNVHIAEFATLQIFLCTMVIFVEWVKIDLKNGFIPALITENGKLTPSVWTAKIMSIWRRDKSFLPVSSPPPLRSTLSRPSSFPPKLESRKLVGMFVSPLFFFFKFKFLSLVLHCTESCLICVPF